MGGQQSSGAGWANAIAMLAVLAAWVTVAVMFSQWEYQKRKDQQDAIATQTLVERVGTVVTKLAPTRLVPTIQCAPAIDDRNDGVLGGILEVAIVIRNDGRPARAVKVWATAIATAAGQSEAPAEDESLVLMDRDLLTDRQVSTDAMRFRHAISGEEIGALTTNALNDILERRTRLAVQGHIAYVDDDERSRCMAFRSEWHASDATWRETAIRDLDARDCPIDAGALPN